MPDNREVRKALENCKKRVAYDRGSPDDKWRGKLTGSPEMAVRSAQARRYWRMAKAGAAEIWCLLRQREALRALAMLLLGPLLSYLALVLAQRWAAGRAGSEGLGAR
ncbi:unnamed protein product [Prorocentrum cordatum]|uniref:Uncharacterized protein n=1 Tax=Prorocentrum cordatum TaxID=2364126 RepID=A0ABN9QAW0_9DINO|nr:unnamed protein product [Polarella glacialis]